MEDTIIPSENADSNSVDTDRREGEDWAPLIELATGRIVDWPQGTTASIHYKVCDDGSYRLLDADKKQVGPRRDGYVIGMMCPGDDGYGDYVIMDVDQNGIIQNWKVDLSPFEVGKTNANA